MNKKLQVFVSSTYTDLKEERQAAVEAILDAGHIPAGMELFKAGNESQLKTIYKWIDESDVYMLILGGRYGTIEEKTGKSYTQLEYEYALSKNIPVFAVVLSESFLTTKINLLGLSDVTEQKAPDKYQTFKSLVMSRIIRMVDDCKDIIIQVHATLNEFMREYDLTGWIRNSNENNTIQLLKNYNIAIKENNALNKQIQELQEQINKNIGSYTFSELVDLFQRRIIVLSDVDNISQDALTIFIEYYTEFCDGIYSSSYEELDKGLLLNACPYFLGFKLLKREQTFKSNSYRYVIDTVGMSFFAELEANNYIV